MNTQTGGCALRVGQQFGRAILCGLDIDHPRHVWRPEFKYHCHNCGEAFYAKHYRSWHHEFVFSGETVTA